MAANCSNANSRARLNMEHGFIKSIVKNQVDRDNYDKEVKKSKGKQGKGKSKKPDVQTYAPPTKSKGDDEGKKKILFHIDYEDQNGVLHPVPIPKGVEPLTIARKFGSNHSFTTAMTKTFALLINEEISNRNENS